MVFALTAWLLPGIKVDGIWSLLFATAVWYILSLTIQPIMFLLTLPVTVVTLGCFAFVISTFTLFIVEYLVPGFSIAGFWSGFFFILIYTILYGIINGRESNV